ncbi:HEXXH motif-containing putative peptide modification protein [Halobacteriovorax sp.]|uniref:aKG-HExxH-type peptide beta-hydroxylase n=1 Tax=Halobacteriovorax sp. TaxID=2020862 RepID=UPI00356A65F3
MITKKNIFDLKTHSKVKQAVSTSYEELLHDLREDLTSGYTNEFFSEGFLDRLKEIIGDKELNLYSNLNFYWSTLLENVIYLVQLHEECVEMKAAKNDEEFAEVEEELFNFWNDSDLTESFLELLSLDNSILDSSKVLQPILENQIVSFFYLNISKNPLLGEESYIYKAIPEKGDNDQCLYLGNTNQLVRLEPACETFPTLPIVGVNKHQNLIYLEGDKRYVITDGLRPLTIENKEIHVLPNCEKGFSKVEEVRTNITKALSIIKENSENLYNTFSSFSHTIIPIDEPSIVSYSQQQLPGFSCINVFERDFVDLIDDLLHENGHHYLNALLNSEELINEDDEKIYFSPWRKSLRPIRGIYHGAFTFYWALELFSTLFENEVLNKKLNNFNEEQKNKITLRFLEEFEMLTFCFEDLDSAYESEKVTDEGRKLIKTIEELTFDKKELALKAVESLDKDSLQSLNELKDLLKKEGKHYRL